MDDISKKMNEFLEKVDALCFEYKYEIRPTISEKSFKKDINDKPYTISIIGYNEICRVIYIDGDGRGK